MSERDELLEVVNEKGETIRLARRCEIHGNPALIHKVVHVLVFNGSGKLLLQKRSMNKDVAPGKWDTSVGGHVAPGEEIIAAAKREMEEELGIAAPALEFLYSYIHRNLRETELVGTFRCLYEGTIIPDRDEIDEARFWSLQEIEEAAGSGIFSSHFEDELRRYLDHTPRTSGP